MTRHRLLSTTATVHFAARRPLESAALSACEAGVAECDRVLAQIDDVQREILASVPAEGNA
jgi:hypothetical protein